jgi:hypothetical protein
VRCLACRKLVDPTHKGNFDKHIGTPKHKKALAAWHDRRQRRITDMAAVCWPEHVLEVFLTAGLEFTAIDKLKPLLIEAAEHPHEDLPTASRMVRNHLKDIASKYGMRLHELIAGHEVAIIFDCADRKGEMLGVSVRLVHKEKIVHVALRLYTVRHNTDIDATPQLSKMSHEDAAQTLSQTVDQLDAAAAAVISSTASTPADVTRIASARVAAAAAQARLHHAIGQLAAPAAGSFPSAVAEILEAASLLELRPEDSLTSFAPRLRAFADLLVPPGSVLHVERGLTADAISRLLQRIDVQEAGSAAPPTLLFAQHDRAAVNHAAVRHLKASHPLLSDIICLSHFLNNVGAQAKVPLVREFMSHYWAVFEHSRPHRIS